MLQEMGIRLWNSAPAAAPPASPPPTATAGVAGVADVASAVGAAQAALETPVTREAPPRRAVTSSAAQAPRAAQAPPGVAPDDARGAAIAAADWPTLRDAVAACQACGLRQTRRQTVFGVGHPQAHWMIVGEAPGEQEDLQGEPFVGDSGQLLDNMLHALQLTRAPSTPAQQVFIANALKCRPPRNRNPEAVELARCEPFLQRQIELIRPRIILAMGRFAVQSLLRSAEPIGKLRGRVHRYHEVPLVVTYHPAYLLRNPADKARAWDDLCLAAQVVEATTQGSVA